MEAQFVSISLTEQKRLLHKLCCLISHKFSLQHEMTNLNIQLEDDLQSRNRCWALIVTSPNQSETKWQHKQTRHTEVQCDGTTLKTSVQLDWVVVAAPHTDSVCTYSILNSAYYTLTVTSLINAKRNIISLYQKRHNKRHAIHITAPDCKCHLTYERADFPLIRFSSLAPRYIQNWMSFQK